MAVGHGFSFSTVYTITGFSHLTWHRFGCHLIFFSDKERTERERGGEGKKERKNVHIITNCEVYVFFQLIVFFLNSHCNRLFELPFIKYIYLYIVHTIRIPILLLTWKRNTTRLLCCIFFHFFWSVDSSPLVIFFSFTIPVFRQTKLKLCGNKWFQTLFFFWRKDFIFFSHFWDENEKI